jgi:ABC-type microcin C transport system permease subunit YejB
LAISFIPELIDRKMVTAKAKPVKRRQIVWSQN